MQRRFIPYNPSLKVFARKLRNQSTQGEILLWNRLKSNQFDGYDFHRQKPLLNYIVDFYCKELNLVIELDGLYHHCNEVYEADLQREQELNKYNLTIIRFSEHEAKHDIENVIRAIETYICNFEINASR